MAQDGLDWPFLLYAGIALVHMPERAFWASEPRKIFALIEAHFEYEKAKWGGGDKTSNKPKPGFIDDIPGW